VIPWYSRTPPGSLYSNKNYFIIISCPQQQLIYQPSSRPLGCLREGLLAGWDALDLMRFGRGIAFKFERVEGGIIIFI
jgi:hypothetical protein